MKSIQSIIKRAELTEARPFNLIITILLLVTSALTVFTGEIPLLTTIRMAAKGESLLGADVMKRLMAQLPVEKRTVPPPADNPLTAREMQTLRAVARGETNKGVARQLSITERTVKAHLTSIYNKLGVDSRAAAIAVAAQRGWLSDP